jgi:ATP-dependent exoDNAse (exonuclease V) beta subunit
VLVGGKAFHEREEVEAIRAALAAIEWPDDELSVFATLRGPFFAIGDEELLEWAHRSAARRRTSSSRRVPPVRRAGGVPGNTPDDIAHLRPIAEALWLLQRLHRHRNYVQRHDATEAGGPQRIAGGVSGTLQELLAATRAHVGFALRIGGEQALANVLHIAELARQYEMNGRRSRSAASSRNCSDRRNRAGRRRRSSRRTATACG